MGRFQVCTERVQRGSEKDRSAAAIQVNIYTNLALGDGEAGEPAGDDPKSRITSGTYSVEAFLPKEAAPGEDAPAAPEGSTGGGDPRNGSHSGAPSRLDGPLNSA